MRLKDKIASGLGSVLEWYDFSLYGFFAPLLAQLYFPSEAPAIGLLKTFSIFAIGFFARPIGALIFGYISDKYGRTISLKLTPLLITCPTLLFCVLPTYQQIGILAPLLLIFLRIWQGICIGGEYANNIVYLCETTKKKHLYFIGSIGSCTGSLGILFASIIAALWYAIFTPEDLSTWGWRLAFAISLIIGITAFWMRRNMQETSVFHRMKQNTSIDNPIFDSYKNQWKDYLLSFGLTFLPATAFYYIFMFLPNFLSGILNYNSSKILGDNSLSLLMRLFVIPIIGFLADKIGGIKIARLSCILFLLLSAPLFYSIVYYPTLSIASIYLFALLTTLNAATTPGLLVEILKPETRCTIFSFTFNVCFGVFGGITPVISFLLVDKIGCKMAPIYYLVFAAFITLIATFFFDKRRVKHET
ncbi:MAG TPA: MFS transporter [Candidatus Babeliales bacterium]|nr:MFS transporter [Candidatus Babeliales bacterium]